MEKGYVALSEHHMVGLHWPGAVALLPCTDFLHPLLAQSGEEATDEVLLELQQYLPDEHK